nr:hypothetical protein [Tanacetum cinerariifolium]
ANLATTTNTTTSIVIDAKLKALIEQGVNAALAARDVDGNTNGDDSHVSGTGSGNATAPAKVYTVGRAWTNPNANVITENQIKFSTCTLLGSALMWWNFHVMTVGPDVAYAMTWADLKKKMTDKYCPRELALLCVIMFLEESGKIERYAGGLLDMIHGSVVASKPKTMQEAIEMATELMDKKIH